VDAVRMKPGPWLAVSIFNFLQCFDTVGRVTGRVSGRKNLCNSLRHTKGDGRLCFRQHWYVGRYIGISIGMFVNNFLAEIQVRLSPKLVSHTRSHRGRGDKLLEGQGQRSRSVGEVCTLLSHSTSEWFHSVISVEENRGRPSDPSPLGKRQLKRTR